MATLKVSSKVDAQVWGDLQALAAEAHQSISGLLTEAIREYLARRRIRPDVLLHLEASIQGNEEMGRLLAE
jgi:predicted transcriptional regulator